jgi:hypothetical protein
MLNLGSIYVPQKGIQERTERLIHRTLYYDAKGYKPDIAQSAAKDGGTGLGEYEQSLLHVGTIDTVSVAWVFRLRKGA